MRNSNERLFVVFKYLLGMHTMPRINPTFTSADLIRFYSNNLDVRERAEVLAFFIMIAGPNEIDEFTEFLEDLLQSTSLRRSTRFLRLFGRIMSLTGALNLFIVSRIFNQKALNEVNAYLED